MRKLYLILKNNEGDEIFSDFIENIDSVDSHTVVYRKTKYSEADVIRMPFNLHGVWCRNGMITLIYDNGVHAEILRK
jgi:hypothetical protein